MASSITSPRARLPLAVYGVTQVLFLMWWAAFHPARLSWDSITYVWQVSTSNWRGDHAVGYDALVWLSLQASGGVALLTLLQTVAMSAVLAYICVALRGLGVRGRWSAPAAVLLAAAPPTGTFVVYVWKDVAFSIGALLAFGAVVRLTARGLRGRQAVRDRVFYRRIALLALGCLAMGVFRNNGFPVIVGTMVVLVLTLPGMRRWTVAATAVPVAVTLTLIGVVYPALSVETPRDDEVYAFNYADIGVAYGEDPGSFTAKDTALMAQVAPLSHWSGPGANCERADPLMQRPMNRLRANELNDELLSLWSRVLRRTPGLVIEARLCRAEIAWSTSGHTGLYQASSRNAITTWSKQGNRVDDLPHGGSLHQDPLSTRLYKAASDVFEMSKERDLRWLLWRGSTWTYVAYGAVLAVALRRRGPAFAALAALPLALQMTVIMANPSPLWRYMSSSLFIGVLSLPLLSLLGRTRNGRAPAETGKPAHGDESRTVPARSEV